MKIKTDVIKYKADKKNITIRKLEALAGVKVGTFANILYGKSLRPSVDTMQRLAIALNCSVNDLITIESLETPKDEPYNQIWDAELFGESVIYITNISKQKRIGLTKEKLIALAEEAYGYSQKTGRKSLDKDFANWIVDKVTL
jgi:transcriptional regulator with XRE-family HTH domain